MKIDKMPIDAVILGCDPEFFFETENKITGAEKILPKEGMDSGTGKVVIDGVQAELNPQPSGCREVLSGNIARSFYYLEELMREKGTKINFSEVIKVEKKELESLSEQSRQFGCAPSTNIHENGTSKITVNPAVYRYRSAGGHIHLGIPHWGNNANNRYLEDRMREALTSPERTVPMLDIILGNTCVLIDRDPWAKERRKVYGRAGEYRMPEHGIEYRTLSNFWLRSYALTSFVMGLARLAVNIIAQTTKHEDYEGMIRRAVNIEDVRKAINENDVKLARKNFRKIEKPLLEIVFSQLDKDNSDEYRHRGYSSPIDKYNIKDFRWFVKKGINHWFKKDPLTEWKDKLNYRALGWESFLDRIVKKERIGAEERAKKRRTKKSIK